MNAFFAIGLTLLFCWAIIIINKRISDKKFGKVPFSQMTMHERSKNFLHFDNKPKLETQLSKLAEKNTVKVIVVDDKAYWVVDNIFYVSEVENGRAVYETAQPIDTNNISKEDIDRMLFVLDNLRNKKK